jgi:hypothetical protein
MPLIGLWLDDQVQRKFRQQNEDGIVSFFYIIVLLPSCSPWKINVAHAGRAVVQEVQLWVGENDSEVGLHRFGEEKEGIVVEGWGLGGVVGGGWWQPGVSSAQWGRRKSSWIKMICF